MFSSKNNCNYTDMVERTIPQLITYTNNEYLTRMLQLQEIHNVVHNMGDNSAPNPNGIGRDGCDQFDESIF